MPPETYIDGTYGSSSDATWQGWTSTSTTDGSANNVIWAGWTSANSGITYVDVAPEPTPETDEQRQARLDLAEQHRIRMETERLAKEEARRKAEELLRETLDAEQLEQFDRTKWFFVIGQSGKRYRIRHGWSGNIDELNELDQVVAEYCIHPQRDVPVEDSMLIQKLMLEADEQRLLQIANRTGHPNPRPIAA